MKMKSESEVAQSCPTLCNPVDGSLSGSSVHGIFQARTLEWAAIAFSIAKGRLKLKKAGKTTRPARYNLNQTPYEYGGGNE